jgi:hypothetical protein
MSKLADSSWEVGSHARLRTVCGSSGGGITYLIWRTQVLKQFGKWLLIAIVEEAWRALDKLVESSFRETVGLHRLAKGL